MILARPQFILLVGIGHLDGQEIIAAGVAPGQVIPPFGSAEIVFPLLAAHRAQSQPNLVLAEQLLPLYR
jgi:hypothetical protein